VVEVTLQFNTPAEFEQELRGVFEVIAMAEEDDIHGGNYAEVMRDTAAQAELAYEKQVLGWFLNGDHISEVTAGTRAPVTRQHDSRDR